MEKSLIIARGLPGSGKTTFANLFGDSHICTADDYHMVGDKYDWKPENVSFAHMKCQEKCEKLMKMNSPKIIVANTSTTVQEMAPYYTLATKYGYKVFSVIVENRHGGANIHNVPDDTIQKMRNRFDIKL
jgi:predicted kinase